jgi:serum/glucocorticoid-regulated kinase 2
MLLEKDAVLNTKLEKEIMLDVDNPFLINLIYLLQNELRLYFVMPFINGGELFQILKKKKRLDEETIKFYSAQLVMAIGHLHSKDIIHRDLKLENILVAEDGYIKIIDYGLAKFLPETELTMT